MFSSERFQTIENHLDQYFDSSDEIFVFDEIKSPDFHLDVYWIKPAKSRNYHILLTSGVSSMPLNIPDTMFSPYVELSILLPENWKLDEDNWQKPENYWPIELLKNTGRYPHEKNTWLGFGHTITQPDNESITGTGFISTLLIKSVSLPQGFQAIPYKNSSIEIYTLFPVFEEELNYKKEKGINSLLEKFDENNVDDIINIERRCVIK